MTILKKIAGKLKSILTDYTYAKSKKPDSRYNQQVDITKIKNTFPTLNDQYNYFHHYFWNLAPEWLKEHRTYFKKDFRGFGEDAFHAMWLLLFKEYAPKNVLEIGIYRGQVISLWGLISEKNNTSCEIHGISPFSPAGDHVSVYLKGINYYDDVIKNCTQFNSKSPVLHKGFSTDESMVNFINSQSWDLIYIDGNHDYEIVRQDFEVCSLALKPGGLIVLDDASLYTSYKPLAYSTAGHPGPSQLANEIDQTKFREILSVGHNRVFKRIV